MLFLLARDIPLKNLIFALLESPRNKSLLYFKNDNQYQARFYVTILFMSQGLNWQPIISNLQVNLTKVVTQ